MRCARTNCGPVLDSRSSTGQGRCVLFRVGWGTLFHSASSHPACKFLLDSSNTRATKKLSWTSVVLFPIIAPTYLSACNPNSGKKERKIITLVLLDSFSTSYWVHWCDQRDLCWICLSLDNGFVGVQKQIKAAVSLWSTHPEKRDLSWTIWHLSCEKHL